MTTGDVPQVVAPHAPYAIGIGGAELHAVSHDSATWVSDLAVDDDLPAPSVGSECGYAVVIAHTWGEFRRDNERMTPHQICPHCAWTVALAQDRAGLELATITPDEAEGVAWLRLLPDPTLFIRICALILDQRQQENEYDADHPRWAQLLGHVTAHRPQVPLMEDCAEGDCEHDSEAECYAVADTAACPGCSVLAGSWAGEWEGQFEVIVPAPCSVLSAMAKAFDVSEVPA